MKIPQLQSLFRRDVDPARYRLEIDGLRFFAIMIVMVGHLLERIKKFWMTPNAHLDSAPINSVIDFFASPNQGVLLFFAISGFIISKQMQDVPKGRFDAAFIGKYYVRRITRIFPPYYAVLIGTFIIVAIGGIEIGGLNGTYVKAVPYSESLFASLAYAHGIINDSMPRLFPLGWSLEIEVQFYLLAPFIFLLLFRGEDRAAPWRFALLLAATFVITFVSINKLIPINKFTIASYIVYFALGIALSRYENVVQRAFAKIGSLASGMLGLATVITLFWIGDAHFDPLIYTLYYWALSLGCVFVLFGLAFQPATLFGKFCRIPVVTYIGLACYSLYLVHMQVFHIATLAFSKIVPISYLSLGLGFCGIMIIGLIAGGLFFALVEKPFASWRPFSSKSRKAVS
ncbi:MAG: acyltransferase [Pseudomonadota bacterium]